MKTLLAIFNVGDYCSIWTSEPRRLEGFRRYLPEFGWLVIGIVKECNCRDKRMPRDFEVMVPLDRCGDDALVDEVRAKLESHGGVVIRLECRQKMANRLWLRLAMLVGWHPGSADDEREIFHLVFPRPEFDKQEESSLLSRLLLGMVKLLSLAVRRPEQDRIDWVNRAKRLGSMLAARVGGDVVLGSFPGVQNLEIAEAVGRDRQIPWVADFRDSVERGWCCNARDASRAKAALKSSSSVLYVTQEEAERDGDLHDRSISIVENGFFESEGRLAVPPDHSVVTIRFAGTMYPGRNLNMFFDGLRAVVESHEEPRVLFEYVGASPADVSEATEARGLSDYSDIRGSISSDRVVEFLGSSCMLVIPVSSDGMSGVPGAKLYEYIGAGRPILAAGGTDAYVREVLERTGSGRLCASVEEIVSTLEDWRSQWLSGRDIDIVRNAREVFKLSRRTGAMRLAGVLDPLGQADS